MVNKKEVLAQVASTLGVTRVLESLSSTPYLLILNYHRIGHADRTPYDSGTFSCTAEELDWQIGWLKERYPILTLDEAVRVVHGETTPKDMSVLITFDDGYLDNYTDAYPVLRQHGAAGTFFLPTYFVGTAYLPWWDEIAYMVKQSPKTKLQLVYPEEAEFDLTDRQAGVTAVLKFFKAHQAIDTHRFLVELEKASGTSRPTQEAERCFMDWDEAREMQAGGMFFGSHTHTHEILGRLPYETQLEELTISRGILERQLGRTIDTLAYPVGQHDTFTPETQTALQAAGYRTAMSFYHGGNRPGQIHNGLTVGGLALASMWDGLPLTGGLGWRGLQKNLLEEGFDGIDLVRQ